MNTENDQLNKLHEIVIKSIEEEKLISQKLYEFEDKHPPFASRLADRLQHLVVVGLSLLFFYC